MMHAIYLLTACVAHFHSQPGQSAGMLKLNGCNEANSPLKRLDWLRGANSRYYSYHPALLLNTCISPLLKVPTRQVATLKKPSVTAPLKKTPRENHVTFHPDLHFLSHFPAPLRVKLESWIIDLSTDNDLRCVLAVEQLREELRSIQDSGYASNPEMFEALEMMFVSLIGHHCEGVRDVAVVDLNMLYDGHNLQAHEALPVTIAEAGQSSVVSITLAHVNRDFSEFDTSVFDRRLVVLRVYGPDSRDGYASSWKEYPLKLSKNSVITCELPPFPCPGFFDWVVAEPGSTTTSSLYDFLVDPHRKLRGRFIVQPENTRQSVIMEMPVDEVGAIWDEETGQLRSRGSFDTVSRHMMEVKHQGVTAVYMMGALERPMDDPDSSPLAVVDRQCPAAILGGARQFKAVVSEIRRLGMTPIVDAIDRVSRNRMHRKYKCHTVETLDRRGIPLRHPGTDCQQNQWEDTALLNYRKIETWKLFLSEIQTLAKKYGVRGIRLDNAQSFPPIMTPNMEELLRVDTDGESHYSLSEVFFGSVVKASSEHGYWGSDSCVERNYPNPFIVKLCKDMWKQFPDFLIIAEAHFHREAPLLASGAITHSIRIAQIMASISGNSFRRDGTVARLPEGKRS
eukprot:IDg13743t1